MRKILSFLVLLLFAVTMSAETWEAGDEIAAADLKAGDIILMKNANTANADAMWFAGYHIVKKRTYDSGCANYSLGMFPYIKNRSAFELVAGPTMNGQASFYFKEVTTGEYIRCTFESSSYVDLTNDVSAATSFIPTAKSSGSYLVSYNGDEAWSLKPFHSYGEMHFGTGGSDMAGFKFYKAEQTSTSFLRSDQVANTEVEDGMELLFQVPYCYYGNSRYGERFAGSQYLDNTQISTDAHKWIASVFSDIPALATSYGYNEDNVWVLEYASPATTTGYSDFYYLKSKSTGEYLFRDADTQVQSSSTTTDKTKATAFTFAPKSAASYGYYSRGDYSNDKTVSLLTDDADYKYFGSGHGYGFAIYSNEKFANWNIYKIVAATPENLQAIAYSELQELIATLEAKRLIGGTTAGYCTEATYAPYETALNAAKALSATDDRSDILSALYDLQEAYEALETVPISEGYYYIISDNQLIAANGKSEKALYTNTSTGTLYWGELDEGDKKFVFKFTGNSDGTWNLQNLDNNKYIGAPKVNSSNNSQFCQEFENTDTSTYPATFIFDGEGSYRIKVDNWTLCPQGNANGKNAGPTYVWAYNAEGIHGEASYTLRKTSLLEILTKSSLTSLSTITPANHHDNTGTRSFLLGNERTSVDGLATSTEHLAELQAAYDDATAALAEGKDENDVPEVYAALVAAKAKVDAKSNPLVDGYYHLIAEYDYQTDGIPGGYVIEADGDGIKKIAYNANEPKQMFKVEYDAANGKVYLQNVANEKYLGVVDGSAWKFSTEKIALNVMTGNDHNWYHSATTTVAARSCSFILSDDAGKGISSTNCGVANDVTNTSSQAWTISWAFRPADDLYQNYIENQELLDVINGATASLNTITPKNHHDNTGTRSFLLGNERTSIDGLATSTEHLAELQTALDALNAAVESGKTYSELTAEIAAVNAAKAKVDAKSNPLVDGYYHLVAEFDGGTDGIPGGFVIEADGDGIKKIAYNANEPKQMFKVEYDAAYGKVYLQNVANEKYLGVVDGSAWKFSTEKIALNVMTGNDHNWYHSAITTVAARSCSFILSDDAGKGISSANCGVRNDVTNTSTEAWFESWAFRPADEYYADYLANGPLSTALDNLADAFANLDYGTNPNEYAQAGVEAFQNLYASDVTAYNGGNNTLTIAEQQALADALSAAYQTALNTRIPLTEGYYVIKSAASAFGANEYAMYIDNNGKVAWKAYDVAAPGEFIFQLTDQNATVTPDGVTYEVFSYYNLYQQKYISQCSAQMAYEDASTSDEVWGACAQPLTAEGQFVIQPMWNPTTVSFCLTVDNTSSTSGIIRTSGWLFNHSGGNDNGCWKFEKVDLEAVTIGATGYSTYVSDKALIIPEGVTAYGVTGVEGTEVVMQQFSGNVLAADVPVILQGEAGKKYYFIATDEIGSTISGNTLEGTGTTGKAVAANEAYVLFNNNGTAVFRVAAAMTLPAHKAYLPASVVGSSGAKEFSFGDLTGVKAVEASDAAESKAYYDLSGRKVAAPQKGQLYIVNGKKVLY